MTMQNAKTRLGQTSGPFCFPASATGGDAPSRETVMQVNVYLSERDAIRAGVDAGTHGVTVDGATMSQAERDYLAKELKTTSAGVSYVSGPSAATAEALVAWLRWEMAVVAKETAKAAAAKAAATAAWLACPDETLIEACANRTVRVRNGWASWGATCASGATGIDDADPAVIAKLARVKDIAAGIQAMYDAQNAAAAAKRQAEKDAAEKALRDWATQHGSELLQERVAGEYNWKALARREYAASVAGGIGDGAWITEPEPWNCDGWDNPTLVAIKAKKAVLAKVPAVRCVILLVSVETDDGKDTFPALRISVECPDGEVVSLVRKIE
jgi:hypothetical protein